MRSGDRRRRPAPRSGRGRLERSARTTERGLAPAAPAPSSRAMALPRENVQDYPRPPKLEPVAERVRVVLGGETIVDTDRALRVLETHHAPTYYLPPDAVRAELRPAAGRSLCEWKGMATYWDVVVGRVISPRAAWSYPRPDAGLRGPQGPSGALPRRDGGLLRRRGARAPATRGLLRRLGDGQLGRHREGRGRHGGLVTGRPSTADPSPREPSRAARPRGGRAWTDHARAFPAPGCGDRTIVRTPGRARS